MRPESVGFRPQSCATFLWRFALKRRSILGITGALVATVVLTGSVLAAGFSNGSFEDGDFAPLTPGFDFDRVSAVSTDVTGWTVTEGSIDWIGTYWDGRGRLQGALTSMATRERPAQSSQTFDTNVNSTYFVSSACRATRIAGRQSKTMTVDAGAARDAPYSYDTSVAANTRADMKWADKSFTFVATSNSTVLTFRSTTPGGFGPAIDNIVITEVLPNGAQCKKDGWQVMVDKNGTPFKNQGDCVSYFATGEKKLAF